MIYRCRCYDFAVDLVTLIYFDVAFIVGAHIWFCWLRFTFYLHTTAVPFTRVVHALLRCGCWIARLRLPHAPYTTYISAFPDSHCHTPHVCLDTVLVWVGYCLYVHTRSGLVAHLRYPFALLRLPRLLLVAFGFTFTVAPVCGWLLVTFALRLFSCVVTLRVGLVWVRLPFPRLFYTHLRVPTFALFLLRFADCPVCPTFTVTHYRLHTLIYGCWLPRLRFAVYVTGLPRWLLTFTLLLLRLYAFTFVGCLDHVAVDLHLILIGCLRSGL